MFRLIIIAVWFFLIGGCSTIYPNPKYEASNEKAFHHIGSDINGAYEPYLEIDSKNKYISPYKEKDVKDLVGNQELFSSYQALLDGIEEKMISQVTEDPATHKKKLKVLIFLHGGLNHPSDNDERLSLYLKDIKSDGYFPIFLSWRSGLFVAAEDRYFKIRNGASAMGPLAPVRGLFFYLPADLLSGAARLPETIWDQGANYIGARRAQAKGTDRDRIEYDHYLKTDVAIWDAGDRNAWYEDLGYGAKQIIPGITRVITTPLVQGLATPAYSLMLRRLENLMVMEADVYKTNASYCGSQCDYEKGNGVLSVLARKLERINADLAAKDIEMEILLVGHSMGAIAANELVHSYPRLPYKTIVHMGAADTMRNWIDKTGQWLRAQNEAENKVEFYNLVLHPTDEEREDISIISLIPEGSLLVWLDDMLTTPDHLLDLRSGRWKNSRYLLNIYADLGNSHLKVFPLNKKDAPHTHGGFGDFRFWRKEFYWH